MAYDELRDLFKLWKQHHQPSSGHTTYNVTRLYQLWRGWGQIAKQQFPALRVLADWNLKKVPIDLNFWTSVIFSVWPNNDNHSTFAIFVYFHRKYEAEEAKMDLRFTLFFPIS